MCELFKFFLNIISRISQSRRPCTDFSFCSFKAKQLLLCRKVCRSGFLVLESSFWTLKRTTKTSGPPQTNKAQTLIFLLCKIFRMSAESLTFVLLRYFDDFDDLLLES